MNPFNHISLFSGQGGFDLAAQWMGWNNIAHCEKDPFCQRILKYYWPNATTHTDIRTTDFTVYNGQCDILTMGVPCQPYSTAGKRLGKEDERHLWPEGFRAVREISPRWVLFENVRGLVNWNGGLVFDEVQADLESAGYEVTPFLLPAAGVNAPHRRDRVWIVAHSGRVIGNGRESIQSGKREYNWQNNEWRKETDKFGGLCKEGIVTNTDSDGQRGNDIDNKNRCSKEENENETQWEKWNEIQRERIWSIPGRVGTTNAWRDFPTQPPICSRNDGLSQRLVSITFSQWRKESLKAAGNAIVPQVAYQIFQAIQQYECSA